MFNAIKINTFLLHQHFAFLLKFTGTGNPEHFWDN